MRQIEAISETLFGFNFWMLTLKFGLSAQSSTFFHHPRISLDISIIVICVNDFFDFRQIIGDDFVESSVLISYFSQSPFHERFLLAYYQITGILSSLHCGECKALLLGGPRNIEPETPRVFLLHLASTMEKIAKNSQYKF